ncbi:RICIN domain-containing protein [Sorangium cellulosum]|uniref:RICIN domain-containing protein n=1 Tax=Sorangium cellulosum TaxID=56 RepID=UPI003D9C0583
MKSIVGHRLLLLAIGASLIFTGCVVEADVESDGLNDADGAEAESIGDADEALEIVDGSGSTAGAGLEDVGSSSAFSLVSLMHGRCLDAPPFTASGPRVYMWDCMPGNANQRWSYNAPTGELRIHGNLCLEASGRSRLSPIGVSTCSGSATQRWDITFPGRAVLRGIWDEYGRALCLDIGYQNRDLGAPLLLQYCHRGDNQEWRRSDSGIGGATFNIESQINRCADFRSKERGTTLYAWDCSGTNENQRFTHTVDGELRIHGKCLDGKTLQPGDDLILWDCHGGSNQKWYRDLLGRLVSIENPAVCADVWENSSYNGAPIRLHGCHTEANQKWYYSQIANP